MQPTRQKTAKDHNELIKNYDTMHVFPRLSKQEEVIEIHNCQ